MSATAESLILSTSVTMLLSALSAPMLMSVAGRSLLIDAGTHTIGHRRPGVVGAVRGERVRRDVARPAADHQQPVDAVAAPARAAMRRPASRSGTNRSVPSSAPGRDTQPLTLIQSSSSIVAVEQPAEPVADAEQACGRGPSPTRTATRTAVFIPGAAPPAWSTASRSGRCPARSGRGRACTIVRSRSYEWVKLPPRISIARVESPVGDHVGDRSGRGHALHQRRPGQAVAPDADQLRLVVGRLEQLADRGVPEHGAEVAVERARRAAALDVAEDRDPGVLAEALLQHAA